MCKIFTNKETIEDSSFCDFFIFFQFQVLRSTSLARPKFARFTWAKFFQKTCTYKWILQLVSRCLLLNQGLFPFVYPRLNVHPTGKTWTLIFFKLFVKMSPLGVFGHFLPSVSSFRLLPNQKGGWRYISYLYVKCILHPCILTAAQPVPTFSTIPV